MWSQRHLSKKALDFRIQIPSDSECLCIPIGRHLVIRKMHAVWQFIRQNRDRSEPARLSPVYDPPFGSIQNFTIAVRSQ